MSSPPSLDEITASFSSMMSEQKEKESRKLNLIMHNMVESNDPIAANRKKHDIDSATDILQRYVGTYYCNNQKCLSYWQKAN